jgi:hypothetical protein
MRQTSVIRRALQQPVPIYGTNLSGLFGTEINCFFCVSRACSYASVAEIQFDGDNASKSFINISFYKIQERIYIFQAVSGHFSGGKKVIPDSFSVPPWYIFLNSDQAIG